MYPLLNILSTIVIFQLLLLSVFLFSIKKGKLVSNRLLAGFFLILAFNLGDALLSYYGFYHRHPKLAHWEDGFVFLIGPVLYFYTKSVVFRNFGFKPKAIFHLIPFALFTISFQVFYHRQPEEFQKFIQSAIQQQQLPVGFYFSLLVVYAHVFTYLFYSYRDLDFYRHQIKEKFSDVGRRNLNWLIFLIFSVGVILILSFIYSFLPLGSRTFLSAGIIVVVAFIFVFINTIVWRALKQPEVFSGLEDELKKEKYAGSGLTETERLDCQNKLRHLVNGERVYLVADLTLDELAGKVGISPKKLSQLINETYRQNFFDFINTQRILEAQRIMTDSSDAKLTVLEIMYQSGFNSKSSFNTLFKKKTGKTPSEFRKSMIK